MDADENTKTWKLEAWQIDKNWYTVVESPRVGEESQESTVQSALLLAQMSFKSKTFHR